MSLLTDFDALTVSERVEAVTNVINFAGDCELGELDQYQLKESIARAKDEELKKSISYARKLINQVDISSDQIFYLCQEATRAGCDGHRGEIFATHIAKACAALDRRIQVNEEDLKAAVRLALWPRSKYFISNMESDSNENELGEQDEILQANSHDSSPSPIDMQEEKMYPEHKLEPKNEDIIHQPEIDSKMEEEEEQKDTELLAIPDQFMFAPNMIPIDPNLLMLMGRTKRGKGGKGSKIYNLERGRFVKAIFPSGSRRGRIAVGATLRAAAPYQKVRRQIAIDTGSEMKVVYVDKSDFRIKRMNRKSGALIILVVDASGSMALNRMDSAKGAAISLLSEAYKARDKVSLIAFHQKQADILVPPTKSTALTKTRLENLPCGGGSPLADALLCAYKIALNELKVKKDVGKGIVVLIADGRCNIPLYISRGEVYDPSLIPSVNGRPTKQFLQDEVLECAKMYTNLDLDLLVIDTEDKFVGVGIGKVIVF